MVLVVLAVISPCGWWRCRRGRSGCRWPFLRGAWWGGVMNLRQVVDTLFRTYSQLPPGEKNGMPGAAGKVTLREGEAGLHSARFHAP